MKRFLLFLILLLVIIYISGKYYYNTGLVVNEYSIKSADLSTGFNGFKIIHFSDLLIDNKVDLKKIDNIVESINDNSADIVVFTGDLIKSALSEDKQKELVEYLSKIECKYNKYAILGDPDTLDSKEILTDSNFKILDNDYDLLHQFDITPIMIVGGNKIEELNLSKESYSYSIALIHKPDYVDEIIDKGFNLILAGHSLGGQIRLPFVGGILKQDGALNYTNDYYNKNNTTIYISYGIGNDKYDFRFLNKPSYNIYRLYTK